MFLVSLVLPNRVGSSSSLVNPPARHCNSPPCNWSNFKREEVMFIQLVCPFGGFLATEHPQHIHTLNVYLTPHCYLRIHFSPGFNFTLIPVYSGIQIPSTRHAHFSQPAFLRAPPVKYQISQVASAKPSLHLELYNSSTVSLNRHKERSLRSTPPWN